LPQARSRDHSFVARVEPEFRALAKSFVPELAGADDEEWRRVVAIVDRALRLRPRTVQRQVVLLIRVLDWLPLIRSGRRFVALDRDRRSAFLERVQDSRWLLLRRGVWGLRCLVFMGYYARPEVHTRLGYRAHRDGWDAPGARTART